MLDTLLGISQHPSYDEAMEAEIGARVRARIEESSPRPTQRELATAIGMTPDAFSRALNGKRAFTAIELVELARELGTSAHWFVAGEPDPFAVRIAGRHTFDPETRQHVPIDGDGEASPLDTVALAYIQAYGDEPPRRAAHPPVSADRVRSLLREAGGDDFVRQFAELIERVFDIDVVRIDTVSRGYALEVLGRRAIVIGETGNWFYENFSLAHELSHVLRGELSERGDSACDDPESERRANAFAAGLLMPRALLAGVDWMAATPGEIADLIWRLGVSTDALRKRLTSLGIRTSPEVDASLELKTQALLRRAWTPTEDGDPITSRMEVAAARRFPHHLLERHRARVVEGALRPATLAWMLGVDESSLAGELAPLPPEGDVDWLAEELGLDVDRP